MAARDRAEPHEAAGRANVLLLSLSCHHCDAPACLLGCPSRAYEKRPDGIVIHHEERCLGCRYCEMTCPFGAPQFDADKGVMSKCHLCAHRVDEARLPACVAACPTEALRFAPAAEPVPEDAERLVPGFADPAGCLPMLHFRTPAGAKREALFRALEEALKR